MPSMLHENATRALMQATRSGESGTPCYCVAERARAPPGALCNKADTAVTALLAACSKQLQAVPMPGARPQQALPGLVLFLPSHRLVKK